MPTADMIFINGDIVTMGDGTAPSSAEALAVKDGESSLSVPVPRCCKPALPARA